MTAAEPSITPAIRFDYAQLADVKLHYAESGWQNSELVILLHGFPEFWYSWRHQLPVLGRHFHVVAPDMRGYNLSDKPLRVEDYRIEFLVNDVLGLVRHWKQEKIILIGHDWGASIAWAVAQGHPEALSKLVALQVPPPRAWRDNITLRQFLRSWYMFFIQLPKIPELWLGANDFAKVARIYKDTARRPEAFTDEDIRTYIGALRQPGALTAALNYYRANVLRSLTRGGVETPEQGTGRIRVPTLFIYGEHDSAVIPATVRDVGRFIDAPFQEVRIADSAHWVQNEAAEEVNQTLLEFLEE